MRLSSHSLRVADLLFAFKSPAGPHSGQPASIQCLRPPTGRTKRRLRSRVRRPCKVGDGDETVARRIVNRDRARRRFPGTNRTVGGATRKRTGARFGGVRGGPPAVEAGAPRVASQRATRAMSKAFVVGAGLMGAAVVAAAAFTVLVFAGLFTVSSGVGGGHRPVTLIQQPPATTTPPPTPSDATDPTPPSDSTAPSPPSTTAQTGRSPLPSSNRVVVPAPAREFVRSRHRHRAVWTHWSRRRRPLRATRLPRLRRRHRHETRTQRGGPLPDATSRALPRQRPATAIR